MTENTLRQQIYNAFQLASENLDLNVALLNNLNVFPIPDQDTGSNMAISMQQVASAINSQMTISEMFDTAAAELLNSSKGNSGTILTLFFQGVAETIQSYELTGAVLARAFRNGALRAAQGVSDPMDGTILTIAQKAGEEGMASLTADSSTADIMKRMTDEAFSVLPLTALQNPTCAKYDVIDAGALGFCMIMDGFLSAFEGVSKCQRDYSEVKELAAKVEATDLVYNYCTEFVIERSSQSTSEILTRQLADIGDCIIPAEMDDKLKMHIHTNKPDAVFFIASLCGPIRRTKVDNMLAQARGSVAKSVDVFLVKEDLALDGLAAMGYKHIFMESNDRTEFIEAVEALAEQGCRIKLYTSAVITGKTADMFPVIRFFTSDEDLLGYVLAME